MAELKVTLKTLTPLWTGGVDGKCDRLHTTGIIGSLRWWYEAIVRGLGGEACDPTEHACLYDAEKPSNGLCPVCQTFGATGWARRFRLVVCDTTQPNGPTGQHQPTGKRYKRGSTTDRPTWYFSNGPGRGGVVTLSVIPLAPDFDPALIVGLLKLIERHAGIAAKTQLGYGWIQLEQSLLFDTPAFVQAVQAAADTNPGESNGLPTLSEMFFAQLETGDPGLTATLNLKYDIREAFRHAFDGDKKLRHFVCGIVKDKDRQAAKIFFSQAVNGAMRVWGWIPNTLPVPGATRSQVIGKIYEIVSDFGNLQSWREYNSLRDTVSPEQADQAAFLTSLLQEGGEQCL